MLELPRTWNVAEPRRRFGLPGSQPVVGRIEQSFVRRLRLLPPDTQLLVLTAAAEPLGNLVLLHRAAGMLGIDVAAADPARDGGLLKLGKRVEFAHPLVRSAAYRSATADDRHRVHRALADATVAGTDPDRRAWHRARATRSPTGMSPPSLSARLTAHRPAAESPRRRRSCQRSAELTRRPGPGEPNGRWLRPRRVLKQVRSRRRLDSWPLAEAGPLGEVQAAQVILLRGQIAFASGMSSDLSPLLMKAARRFEPVDLDLARETYLDAYQAAPVAGHLARQGWT